MSDESPVLGHPRRIRSLRDEEKALVVAMVRGRTNEHAILTGIDREKVEEMNDCGMGSLKFVRPSRRGRRFAKQLSEATYADIDGVPVSIAINLDQDGELFELDIFKADSSTLLKFPTPNEISIQHPASQ